MPRPPHVLIASATLVLLLGGCAPEPPGADSPGSTPSSSPTPRATATATATPTPTVEPVALPTACDQLYSAGLLARLSAEAPPLNDPGLSELLSTESVAGLDVLESGVPTLRCTWGAAGSPGLATTVARVDDDTSSGVEQQLSASGFTCGELSGGTVCRVWQETIDQNDQIRTNGETHWFGSGFWVATHWIDFDPEGYTEDIAAVLAG